MPCYITSPQPPSLQEFDEWTKNGYTGDYSDYLSVKERGEGLKIFMCGRNLSMETCPDCGGVADYLCDYPVGKSGKTCDRRMCSSHAHQVGENMHYCDTHFREWKSFRAGRPYERVGTGTLAAANDAKAD